MTLFERFYVMMVFFYVFDDGMVMMDILLMSIGEIVR